MLCAVLPASSPDGITLALWGCLDYVWHFATLESWSSELRLVFDFYVELPRRLVSIFRSMPLEEKGSFWLVHLGRLLGQLGRQVLIIPMHCSRIRKKSGTIRTIEFLDRELRWYCLAVFCVGLSVQCPSLC